MKWWRQKLVSLAVSSAISTEVNEAYLLTVATSMETDDEDQFRQRVFRSRSSYPLDTAHYLYTCVIESVPTSFDLRPFRENPVERYILTH